MFVWQIGERKERSRKSYENYDLLLGPLADGSIQRRREYFDRNQP